MIKKITALTLVILMLFSFIACDSEAGGNENTKENSDAAATSQTTEAQTTAEAGGSAEVTDKLVLFADGETKYKIVYPSVANDTSLAARTAASALKNAFASAFGVTPETVSESTEATEYEIIIGNTERTTSAIVLAKNEYIIKASNKKIFIFAGSDEALTSAVTYFINTYVIKDQNGACYISLNLSIRESAEINEKTINLKTATYNIKNGELVEYNYNLIAQDILNEGAEIVALQEIDKNTTRNGNKDTMAILSEKTGYQYYKFAKAINVHGGEYGVAILSKYPITETEIIDLPELSSEDENRVCLHAKININGFILDYFVTHTNMSCVDVSLTEINKSTSQCSPFILAGDFNTSDFSKFMAILNSYTANNSSNNIATAGTHKFDNFVLSNKITTQKVYAKDTGHSDHCMLVCELTIPIN